MTAYGKALKSAATTDDELISLTGSLTLEQTKNVLISKKANAETVKNVLASRNLTKAETQSITATIAKAGATTTVTTAVGAYTAALWANVKAMAASILTNPVTYLVAIGVAIGTVINSYKKLNPTIEEQREKLQKTREEYDAIKEELKALNDEQTTTLQLISELQEKKDNGTISLVEEDQLKKLKIQNELLEQQITLQEDLENKKKATLREENRETFHNDFGGDFDKSHSDMYFTDAMYASQFSRYEHINDEELILLLKENEKRLDEAVANNDEEMIRSLSTHKKFLMKELEERSNDILLILLGYKENIAAAMKEDGSFDSDTDKKTWEEIESWEKSIYKYSNRSGEWNTMQIKAALDTDSLVKAQDELTQKLQKGVVLQSDISKYDGLNEALQNANLIVEEGETPLSVYLQYLKSIAATQNELGNEEVKIFSFDEVISELEESYTTLESVKEEVSESKKITIGTIQDIASKYPQLTAILSDYVEGKKTEQDVINALSDEYDTDMQNYKAYLLQKNGNDVEFYKNLINNISDDLIARAKSYGIDLEKYDSYNEAKLVIDKKYVAKKASLEKNLNRLQNFTEDFSEKTATDPSAIFSDEGIALQKMRARVRAQQIEFENFEEFLKDFDTSIDFEIPDFNTNLFKTPDDGKKDKEKFKDSIDWTEQTVSNIEQKIGRINEQISNTEGIDDKIALLEELKAAQEGLAEIKAKAVGSYEEEYTNALNQLTPAQKKKYQALIESDGELDIEQLGIQVFEGEKDGKQEELFNKIKAARELWETYQQSITDSQAADQAVKDTDQQISDTNVLERSQQEQARLERELDTVNEKLKDSSLSTKDKNDLLLQQYNLQKSINDELRTQANHEGNTETVAKLDAEDKNNEHEYNVGVYENNKDDKLREVDKNNNEIADIQNAIDLRGYGTKEEYTSIISLQDKNLKKWEEQKKVALEMRDANKGNLALYQYWDNELQECEDRIGDINKGIKESQTAVINIPLQKVEEKLKSINKELNLQNAELETKDELINAAIGVFDDEIDKENLLKEALEDKIETLEKEHDIRKANIAVQKAAFELEKAKNNKVTKVFREGSGFVFEADAEAVKDAELALEEATHERKIELLNQEVQDIDTSIKLLTRQKKLWEDINTKIERTVLLNKALSYDTGFKNKVLSGDEDLLNGISEEYGDIYTTVKQLEDSKKPYELLQEEITDIAQQFSLSGLSYEDALARTEDAISKYYPELLSKYEEQKTSLEDVAKKQLETAGVTDKTSENNAEEIKTTNGEITQSYDTLLTELTDTFEKLGAIMTHFANMSMLTASSVISSVSAMSSAISGIDSGKALEKITNTIPENYKKLDDATLSAFNTIAGNLNAAVSNNNIAPLFSSGITPVTTNNTNNKKSVTVSIGDIIVNEATNATDFAKTIVSSLPNAMKQELYK